MPLRSFDARFRWTVIAPFVVVVVLLAALAAASIDALAGARAYVGGESRWSKAQKAAVYHLLHYAESRRDADFQKYLDALAVPRGDRVAREELERDEPDLVRARQALVQGGNHPDDVDSMIRLFQRFREVEFMDRAVRIWAQADEAIDALDMLANRIRTEVQRGDAGAQELQRLVLQVGQLDERLTQLELDFSATLGQASRLAQTLILWVLVVTSGALALVGIGLTTQLLSREATTARALRESNERWTLATEAAGIGVFDWDLGRDRVSVDARAAALYGLPREDAVLDGRRLSRELVHEDDAGPLRRALHGTLDDPQPLHIRYRVHLPDGRVRHLQLDARTRVRGDVTRLIGILSDVSDDVQAEQLRLEREGALRVSRAKTTFLSRASHELRTPLNAVLGFAQLLQSDPDEPLTPKQRQRVQQVLDSGQQLLELIDDILDLTGLEAETLRLHTREVPLAEVLAGTLARTRSLADERGVDLVPLYGHEPLPWVKADAQRLQQSLQHLLSNAVKYNRPGGRVDLCVDSDGEMATVSVRDTGRGIAAAQLDRLFQPFDRLGAEGGKVRGSGLGLVIARQLLRRMGGDLVVSSEEGLGTCAELSIPLARPDARPSNGDSFIAQLPTALPARDVH
jgi:PAS domain S-box-containing protein